MKKAVFYIRSPFQMLCAINALIDFHINQYTIYVLTDENMRVSQIDEICNSYNIKYETFSLKALVNESFWKLLMLSCKASKIIYDYVFVGDFREFEVGIFASRFLSKDSSFYFLDDGNISITLFKGKYKWTFKNIVKNTILRFIVLVKTFRRIIYYSIFSDIRCTYHISPNQFTSISRNSKIGSGVYFIGTTPTDYCEYFNINLNKYENYLSEILSDIVVNYPQKQYYYIPHGRDSVVERTQYICAKAGFEFLPMKGCVEFYFIKNKIMPAVCCGLGSTALFTIKKLSPATICIHYELYGNRKAAIEEYQMISDYYKNNNIEIKSL